MQGKHLFEYAIIRIVPKVEREEFVNVGVVICCKRQNFIRCQIHLNEQKVLMLDTEADFDLLSNYLDSFEKICKGDNPENPIAHQDAASRFRWLTAVRSSMLQTSRPHSGFTLDLEESLTSLMEEYVF
jgi:CRISPR/Cas system Type II protein with McrA/HNH and RuvC-like nuclease domain